MGFLDFIENLQKKTEAARKRIVFLSALAITILVFIVWLAVLLNSLTDKSPQNQEKINSPLESIKEDVLNFYESIRKTINE